MKKRDLEKALEALGWWNTHRGGKHDKWTNGDATEPVPRHSEIAEYTARKILKRAAANPPRKG